MRAVHADSARARCPRAAGPDVPGRAIRASSVPWSSCSDRAKPGDRTLDERGVEGQGVGAVAIWRGPCRLLLYIPRLPRNHNQATHSRPGGAVPAPAGAALPSAAHGGRGSRCGPTRRLGPHGVHPEQAGPGPRHAQAWSAMPAGPPHRNRLCVRESSAPHPACHSGPPFRRRGPLSRGDPIRRPSASPEPRAPSPAPCRSAGAPTAATPNTLAWRHARARTLWPPWTTPWRRDLTLWLPPWPCPWSDGRPRRRGPTACRRRHSRRPTCASRPRSGAARRDREVGRDGVWLVGGRGGLGVRAGGTRTRPAS